MNTRESLLTTVCNLGLQAAAFLALSACGGGSGSSNAPTQAQTAAAQTTVNGVAATGKPIAGATVTLKDAAGNSATATTASDGSFKLTSTIKFTPPLLVQVAAGAGANLYSVSDDTQTTTTINVTPLSDMIVRAWYGIQATPVAADAAFASPASNMPPSPSNVESLMQVVGNVVQSFLTNAGVPTSFNFITSSFAANGTGFDKALDQVGPTTVNATANTIAITATNGAITQTSTLQLSASTVTVTTATTGGGNGASSSSVVSTVVPVTSTQIAAQSAIASLLANFAAAINTAGASLTSAVLQPYTDPALLNDGLNQSQFLANLVTQFAVSSGPTVSLTILQLKSLDTTQNVADAVIQLALTQGSQTSRQTSEFYFKEVGGNWVISGDQRIAKVDLAAQYSTQILPPCPSTCPVEPAQGLVLSSNVDVPNQTGGALGLASVPTISGGAGGLLNSALYTDAGPDTSQTPIVEFYYFAYPPLAGSPALNPTSLPVGTPFTVTLAPAAGGTVSYTLPLNSWTTDPVVLTSPTSTALAAANLGGSLSVSWTLPTTYPVAQVKLGADGQETTGGTGAHCSFGQSTPNWPTLGSTSTTATISLPTTCPDGNPIVTVGINVTTIGVDGEQSSALILMQ